MDDFWKNHAAGSPHPHLSPEQLGDEVRHLEHKVEKLTLTCRAMWELLSKKQDMNEKSLIEKIAEIDLLDGQLNENDKPDILTCPKCNHKVNSRHPRCIYCGFHDFGHHGVFD